MEQNAERDPRSMWAFGIAAGLSAIGALAPLAFTVGAHSRVSSVAVPFGVAAVALAVNAFLYHQGRTIAVALYFVAGLAIVYGILAMLAVPLRLAVVGTCPSAPAPCPIGFEPQLTSGENSGLGTATFCGILAIFIGFYGLVILYRRSRTARIGPEPKAWPATPPVQAAPTPEAAPAQVEAAHPEPVEVATAQVKAAQPEPVEVAPAAAAEPEPVAPVDAAPAPKRARRTAAKKASPPPAPPADEELKELPAPEELKELPPPA